MKPETACGKVILLGEHAVVYGRPCLAAGIDLGAEAHAEPDAGDTTLTVAPWNVTVCTADLSTELAQALHAMSGALPETHGGMRVTASMRLPPGGGLGSSAALGVAVARAIGRARLGRALTLNETIAAALAWERVFHGNPSGVDHTMAARGGAAVFSKTDGFSPLRLERSTRVILADTGERTPTRDTVASVARQHARRPDRAEQTFDAIATLVRNGALALEAGDGRALGQLMDLNQALLSSLLLSTERTEQLCRVAREAGAWGAKLTGGGGGGCIVTVAPLEHEEAVLAAFERAGAPVFRTVIGGEA